MRTRIRRQEAVLVAVAVVAVAWVVGHPAWWVLATIFVFWCVAAWVTG